MAHLLRTSSRCQRFKVAGEKSSLPAGRCRPTRGQDHAVDWKEIWAFDLSPQDRDFVAQGKQLAFTPSIAHVPYDANAHDESDEGIDGGEEHTRGPYALACSKLKPQQVARRLSAAKSSRYTRYGS